MTFLYLLRDNWSWWSAWGTLRKSHWTTGVSSGEGTKAVYYSSTWGDTCTQSPYICIRIDWFPFAYLHIHTYKWMYLSAPGLNPTYPYTYQCMYMYFHVCICVPPRKWRGWGMVGRATYTCTITPWYYPPACQYYVMLCYVMLCYVMLCYCMLCCIALRCVMLCYVIVYVMLCYVMVCYPWSVCNVCYICYVMVCYVM